jgi:hypothetical protein
MLLHSRLTRLAQRFAALAARAEAGTLRPPRRRSRNKSPPRERQPRLPQNFAWLIRLVPEAACFGSQLQHLLSQPEMAALLETAPQAGRLLRPLCRMLAIPVPPALRLPPRPPPPDHEPKICEPGKPDPAPERGRGRDYVWRRWRGIRMPEPLRPPKPA